MGRKLVRLTVSKIEPLEGNQQLISWEALFDDRTSFATQTQIASTGTQQQQVAALKAAIRTALTPMLNPMLGDITVNPDGSIP